MTKKTRKRPLPPQPPQYPPPVYAPPLIPQPFPAAGASIIPSASILQDKNASVAKVTLLKTNWGPEGHEYAFTATGSAKREQGDRFDPAIGERLALARAFMDLAQQLMKEGTRLVEAMTQEQRRAVLNREAKVARLMSPPKPRRTREEWEHIQQLKARNEAAVLYATQGEATDAYSRGLPGDHIPYATGGLIPTDDQGNPRVSSYPRPSSEWGTPVPIYRPLQEASGEYVPAPDWNKQVITLSEGRSLSIDDEGFVILNSPGKLPIRLTKA